MNSSTAKIALVFDWMTSRGGAEKVNLVLHKLFPNAPIFTSIYNQDNFPEFRNAQVQTSFINNLPFAKSKHQLYLSLMPYAYEQFDLSNFDIVISSSHSCAKGIITKPQTLHISYCHSPMRYAWDNWQTYIKEYKMNPIIKHFGKKRIHKIRLWDRLSADRVDYFISNSSLTRQRIKKYYQRDSEIIHPMINSSDFKIGNPSGYFLAVGRLTPSKKFKIVIDAFNKTGLPLKIVGTGIQEKFLQSIAKPNIEFYGYTPNETLQKLYSNAEALIFPQVEDFGITALEAMASGRPIIAYKKGGILDSTNEDTAIYFGKQTAESLVTAIEQYQKQKKNFNSKQIRSHAKSFDQKHFEEKMIQTIETQWQNWQAL